MFHSVPYDEDKDMQQPIGTIVLLIFIGTYLAISSERVNRTAMAMTGMGLVGLVLWIAHTLDPLGEQGATFTHLVEAIEWQTLLFVTAMMVIVAIAGQSGMFQYMALNLAKPAGGHPQRIFIVFIVFVFFISLLFDTTSTILIMAPLTIEICKALEVDFKPFLIGEAVTANFASIPSVVGAVPNLVIAGETGLDAGFLFLTLMPLAVILLIVSLFIMLRWFDSSLVESEEALVDAVTIVTPERMIRSRTDFYAALFGIFILALGFMFGTAIGLEPSLIAVLVAFALLLMAHEHVERILSQISWGTVFFLIGIFGLVGSLEIVGAIDDMGLAVEQLVGENTGAAVGFLVWVPSVLSAIIDNIPVSVVLAPIAVTLAETSTSQLFSVVLVFAVNVGGYLLPIGAPANILAMAMAEKERDPISFAAFAKVASVLALIHLAIGTGWLLLLSVLV
jgi:Na+/H+ antiporter NhaD/arsenite permease-like protein